MANITAAEVNELRKQTGAGMMDCKKALVEADGDFQLAIENLRKKGQKLAASRADRDASEGIVLTCTSAQNDKAFMIMLNCETDFVAKNQEMIDFASSLLDIAVQNNCKSAEEVLNQTVNGRKVSDLITDMIGKTGEKLDLAKADMVEGKIAFAYTHPGNRVGSIAALTVKDVKDIENIGKDVVMQIAAMAPIAIDKDDVCQTVINKEIEIGKDQAREEGKPEEMLEKIALGKLNKFYKENTLLNQEFIKDNKKTVGQMLTEAHKDLTVVAFKRYTLS
ncbi:MAG: elongation factor Ts [Bacteroidetes bacterium]|nr:elongation factor Ts [Bacteroidota bacterium]